MGQATDSSAYHVFPLGHCDLFVIITDTCVPIHPDFYPSHVTRQSIKSILPLNIKCCHL